MKKAPAFNFFNSLILLIVALSLINASIFIYPTLAALYGYLLGITVFAVVTGVILINKRAEGNFSLPAAIFLFVAFVLYTFSNALLNHQPLILAHTYWLLSLIFLLCIMAIVKRPGYSFGLLFNGIVIIAVIEAIICFSQYAGLVNSQNSYFDVTGTWVNPNVTAMFLALCTPIVVVKLFSEQRRNRNYYIAALSIIILALLMLRCRSALLGSITSAIIIANYRYNLIGVILNKRNRLLAIILLITGSGITYTAAVKMYMVKQESANSRKIIWERSLEMIKDNPLTGYGYGLFERSYNLYQASHPDADRNRSTGFVRMAYNEILQQGVEGGIIGLLIFTAFLVAVVIKGNKFLKFKEVNPVKSKKERVQPDKSTPEVLTAYAGLSSFMVMSMINFTIQAAPVMCLFMVFCGIILSKIDPLNIRNHIGRQYAPAIAISMSLS